MPQVQSELPGREEPVVSSRRGDTSREPLPGDGAANTSRSENLTISQAAERLASRRRPQAPPAAAAPPPATPAPERVPESDQPEEEESEQPELDTDLPDTEDAPAALDSEEEQPEFEDEDSEQPETLFVAGQERTLPEVEEGFLRQEDYTRKTQQLAERVQETAQLEERYASRLGHLDGILRNEVSQFDNVNWSALAAQDMQQYTVLQAKRQEAVQRFEQHQAQVNDFFSQVEERKKAEHLRAAENAKTVLTKAFKGQWNNARYYDLIDFMSGSYGVERESLLSETNPLLFRMAAEAQAFRAAKSANPRPKVKRSGKRVTNSRRTTTAGVDAVQKSDGRKTADSAMKDLREKGNLNAAALALATRRQQRRRK